jgi:hypothetical protein
MRGHQWSADEVILAMEFYHTCPEAMTTDAHPTCQAVAHQIGRSAGGLDGIIRNIKNVETQTAGFPHASQLVHEMVEKYRGREDQLKADAAAIRQKRGLPPLRCGE